MVSDVAKAVCVTDTSPESDADTAPARKILLAFLQENMAPLLGAIRLYVSRLGLAQGTTVLAATSEVLQEVVVEALSHADRFDPSRQPMAWLLGIAINVIRRQKTATTSRARRELPLSLPGGSSASEGAADDGEPFDLDHVAQFVQEGPENIIEAAEQARLLLSLVSGDDQRILRLAVLEEVSGENLARRLGTTPGTARVRLHRALDRLRSAWIALQAVEHKQEVSKSNTSNTSITSITRRQSEGTTHE